MEIMKKTKENITDAARDLRSRMQFEAQAKFVQQVQRWEKCTWDEAIALCSGTSPERHPEYVLGYKMSDPLLMQALYLQISRNARESAKQHFRDTLDEDCKSLFDANCKSIGDAWKKEYKAKGGR